MFLDKYNDHPVWSSKWNLTSKERRVLSWRYGVGSEPRSTFMGVSFCVGAPLALIALGLEGPGSAFSIVTSLVMLNLLVLGAMDGMVQTTECFMRFDDQFRFSDMQKGAPAFDLAVRYCMLACGDLREVTGTQWLSHGLRTGNKELDTAITKLLVESWQDDYRAVSARGRARRARWRLRALERAVKRFRELPSDTPEGFDEYCQAMIDEARRQYKAALARKYERLQKEIQRDIARSQRELMKVERCITELDTLVEQSDVGSSV